MLFVLMLRKLLTISFELILACGVCSHRVVRCSNEDHMELEAMDDHHSDVADLLKHDG